MTLVGHQAYNTLAETLRYLKLIDNRKKCYGVFRQKAKQIFALCLEFRK